MKTTQLTRPRLQSLADEINKALQSIAERNGLQTLKLGKCLYSRDLQSATWKLEAVVKGALSAEEKAYDELRAVLCPKLPERGTVITLNGKRFAVYGIKPRGSKVLLRKEGEDHAAFNASVQAVERAAAQNEK